VAKVLVVDDSLSVCKAIERMLAPRGLEVAICASGGEALARLAAEAPDLLICDLVLPDLDGYEVCRWLRQVPALAVTPVLFISGIVDPATEERVASLGVEGVLKKPFTGDELVTTVERILAASRAEPWSAAAADDQDERRLAAAAAAEWSPAEAARRTRELLFELTALSGFRYALLQSPAGQVLAAEGELTPGSADLASGPLARWLAATETTAADLGLGTPSAAVLEADAGTLLAQRIDARATLLLVLSDSAALGKARFFLGRLRRALLAAWDGSAPA
jgi:CheY-like chemotaxis protein/predicted regulator of Ras-like GTPase activity (Roadblock/LC7/MglB family)